MTIPLFVVDVNGARPWGMMAPDTPLYDMRTWSGVGELKPILAPDDSLVTWDEYSGATGSATVEAVDGGTHASLEYEGLIPNGVYTVWNVVFQNPGYLGTLKSVMANLVGVSPLGPPDASENGFQASASGEGHVSTTTPGGSPLYAVQADPETGEPIIEVAGNAEPGA